MPNLMANALAVGVCVVLSHNTHCARAVKVVTRPGPSAYPCRMPGFIVPVAGSNTGGVGGWNRRGTFTED